MFLGTMHFVKFLMLVGESVKPLQFYCSSLPASVLVHQRRILFWLKMVRSDNVVLHTLAGCSRGSVVALSDKYSLIDLHCNPSILSSRDRLKFGFGYGFGAETDLKCSFGSVSVPTPHFTFGFGRN